MSVDRLIYVCDRVGDRLQVFTPDGKFVKEAFFKHRHEGRRLGVGHRLLEGSAAAIHLHGRWRERARWSSDRQTLKELTTFGDGGRQPGQFYGVHSIAIDSKGNLYTTETYEGKRIQKFMLQGHGAGDETGSGSAVA